MVGRVSVVASAWKSSKLRNRGETQIQRRAPPSPTLDPIAPGSIPDELDGFRGLVLVAPVSMDSPILRTDSAALSDRTLFQALVRDCTRVRFR
jgi:hypothetical protein